MNAAAEAPPGAQATYTHRQIMLIMSGLMMGLLLAALDQTIVTTALTTISRDFHRLDLYSWVITAYLLTSTASTPSVRQDQRPVRPQAGSSRSRW